MTSCTVAWRSPPEPQEATDDCSDQADATAAGRPGDDRELARFGVRAGRGTRQRRGRRVRHLPRVPADGVPAVRRAPAVHGAAADEDGDDPRRRRAVRAEPQPESDRGQRSGVTFATTPEAGFQPVLDAAKLTDIGVSLPVPPGLLEHPRLLAAFIDFRLIVRFGTTENQVLLRGSDDGAVPGLLDLPEARRLEVDGRPVDVLTKAAALVEETGGSCDGIVAHNAVYWQAVESGLLGRLAEAGVRIARTRMIPEHQVLLGDFRAATTFLDPGISHLRLRRGAADDGGDLLEAESRMGLAVHLPQHFVLLEGAS
ncbi:family 3 encapsulin nanocompartment shell protein [Lentzea guizhouensis]|uniref:family 3 encapsulin nanocompartment shell protein n=1 Tax=Lentzea guizhouensis TaxID=1586287 RepID=UPI002244FBFE|nr:family 3 encapsulin nanocompartment shell protein [Lentzea guizhouensis]